MSYFTTALAFAFISVFFFPENVAAALEIMVHFLQGCMTNAAWYFEFFFSDRFYDVCMKILTYVFDVSFFVLVFLQRALYEFYKPYSIVAYPFFERLIANADIAFTPVREFVVDFLSHT